MHVGDMQAQINKSLGNVELVLNEADYEWADVARVNFYTTDVPKFFEVAQTYVKRLSSQACRPSSTLLGVAALFHPDALIEIEITATR